MEVSREPCTSLHFVFAIPDTSKNAGSDRALRANVMRMRQLLTAGLGVTFSTVMKGQFLSAEGPLFNTMSSSGYPTLSAIQLRECTAGN
jgi:hypothetical protein